jgi:hypothetical protein
MTPSPRQLAPRRRPDALDTLLLLVFLCGIYLEIELKVATGVPIPSVLAGIAGALMLVKHAGRIESRHLIAILAIVLLYALSILGAARPDYLLERFKGVVQISYSLTLAYAFFLTARDFPRRGLARIFLAFTLAILIGCALENYTSFRDISDAFRVQIYQHGLYESDMRDQILYGRVRPKFFSSEPSAVSFMFTLCAFAWYALSAFRLKLPLYTFFVTCAFVLMRGPTLMLCLALVVPYTVFLAPREIFDGRMHYNATRGLIAICLSAAIVAVAVPLALTLYAERLELITSGGDPSFFSRVIAPYQAAMAVIAEHPVAGSGLTAWEFIEPTLHRIYDMTATLTTGWSFDKASSAITNFFWLHWIFLGLFWGSVLLVAWSVFLRVLGVSSLAFCWSVWAILGQASGSYVSPKTWFVLILPALCVIMHDRLALMRALATPPAPRREPQLSPLPGLAAP